MKWSKTPQDKKAERKKWIDERWTQFSDTAESWNEEGIKYLLAANAGAMAAALGLLGAMPHLREVLWPRVSLLFFALGLLAIGIYHLARFIQVTLLFWGWRNDVKKYLNEDSLTWNELTNNDEVRSKFGNVGVLLFAGLSFAFLIIGLIVATANFADITKLPTKGGTNERTKDSTSTTAPNTITPNNATGATQIPDAGQAPTGQTGQDNNLSKNAGTKP
jgi:hypothetical protein